MSTSVFTCGVFDLLHWGHVSFLQSARALGDCLIVGVNDDDYVRRRKGHDPIIPLSERMAMLSALECVSVVLPFTEDTPCALIQRVNPSLVCKGSEYSRENAPEAELIELLGGQFVVLPSHPMHTSDLVRRLIRRASPCEA